MHRERGFILPMVIFSLAIMGVLVLTMTITSTPMIAREKITIGRMKPRSRGMGQFLK